mgnify:FL=1
MFTMYRFAKYNHNCTPKKNATIAATHAKTNLGKNNTKAMPIAKLIPIIDTP